MTWRLTSARPMRYTAPSSERQGRHRCGGRGAGAVLRGPGDRVTPARVADPRAACPGSACRPALPLRRGRPIRLDVAGFVGFAERGSARRAAAVEDPDQYAAVFGGDLPLAVDAHGVPGLRRPARRGAGVLRQRRPAIYVIRVVGDEAVTLACPCG